MHIECGTVDCGREYTYSAISVGGLKKEVNEVLFFSGHFCSPDHEKQEVKCQSCMCVLLLFVCFN